MLASLYLQMAACSFLWDVGILKRDAIFSKVGGFILTGLCRPLGADPAESGVSELMAKFELPSTEIRGVRMCLIRRSHVG